MMMMMMMMLRHRETDVTMLVTARVATPEHRVADRFADGRPNHHHLRIIVQHCKLRRYSRLCAQNYHQRSYYFPLIGGALNDAFV